MKYIFGAALLLLSLELSALPFAAFDAPYGISRLRTLYPKASVEEELGRQFYNHMSAYRGKDPVVLGYRAVSEAVMAKHVWSPYAKLRHLRNAEAIFQEAVQLDPHNAELRFLRYTVEYFVPRYLKMSEHVNEDRKIILHHLLQYPASGLDAAAFTVLRDFMLQENHTTSQEKEILLKK